MNKNEQCASIDLDDLANVTGGWNPLKSAWNEAKKLGNDAKQLGHEAVAATTAGIDYVKQHPDILLQAGRALAV